MKSLPFLFFCIISLCLFQPAWAVHPISTTATNHPIEIIEKPVKENLTKKQLKKQEKRAKRLAKWEAKAQKKLQAFDIEIDLEDSVRKWFWFGIFGIAIAIALGLIAFILNSGLFYRLSYITGVAGLACLIVWFIKHSS